MILIAYDGSPDAKAAIDHAAQLMPGAEAVVLTAFAPMSELFANSGAVSGLGMVDTLGPPQEIDAARTAEARATATEGAERARAAGLKATPRQAIHRRGHAAAILAVATEVHADAIVMGTRGRSGIKSLLLGSVAHDVVHHAACPVIIVPSPERAEHHLSWIDRAMATT